jgi:hypothetical protein
MDGVLKRPGRSYNLEAVDTVIHPVALVVPEEETSGYFSA